MIRVFDQSQAIASCPAVKHERTGADRCSIIGCGCLSGNNRAIAFTHVEQEKCVFLIEVNLDSSHVQRCHAFDRLEDFLRRIHTVFGHCPIKRKDHVLGIECTAIVELCSIS